MDAATGALGDTMVLGSPGQPARAPALAASASKFCAFWLDGSGESVTVKGAVMSADGVGARISPVPPLIPASPAISAPEVASNGESCLVLWAKSNALQGMMLDPGTGAPVSADALLLDEGNIGGYTAASDGSDYLASWMNKAGHKHIFARRVEGASGELGEVVRVSDDDAHHYNPHAAWDGSAYLVLWESNQSYPEWNILGRRIALGEDSAQKGRPFLVQESAYAPALAPLGEGRVLATVSTLVPESGTQRVRWFSIAYRPESQSR